MTTAYPLAWPQGWPRTAPQRRERWPAKVALSAALAELHAELGRLGVKGVVLSSNCTLGMENAPDPGVVAYGMHNGQRIAIPCDRWNSVAGNVRAIARTIEAMRGMERWGAKHMITAMFQGFTALPAAGPGQKHWREVLIYYPDSKPTRADLEARRRDLAKTAHPDRAGGSDAAMADINAAFDQAVEELGL